MAALRQRSHFLCVAFDSVTQTAYWPDLFVLAAKTIFFVYYYPTAAPTTHPFLIATLPFAGGEKEERCDGGGVRLLQLGSP